MKSRVAQYQRCCKDLVIKFNTRLNLGGTHQGARIEAAVKEFSMYRLYNNVYSLRLMVMVVDVNILKMVKDDQLGSY